ncbi:RidA family protein [Imperialibacter roseus]|uniref:RidA family protein n=1 Tax=Imperialibacter roseus TaxID=1324217 RepID=A0ABZ0IJ54_9BACT|nr:RidA family protein [Imperialibacter roseus]WOK04571.1 RidA family protein [Imperialibacter roseus]
MKRAYLNPKLLPDWSQMFSQVVVTEAHGLRFIHVSGQVAVNASKEMVGAGSLKHQTDQALLNLKTAVESGGASMSDVMKLTIYVVDYRYEQAEAISSALRTFFENDKLPALSLIGVAGLAMEHFLIEIDAEVVAVTGK